MRTITASMLSLRNITIIVILGLFLGGCPEKTQTLDWYKTHKKERDAMLQKCAAQADKLSLTDNCQNAVNAAAQLSIERSYNAYRQ